MATDRLINKDQGDSMITALGNIATNINTITYGPQTSADKVVSMTGYQKSSAADPGAISQGDTLNEAVGKLEKKVDNNATAIADKIESYTDATTSGHVVTFNNSTGTQVTDSGVSIATSTTGVTDVDTTIPTSKSVVAYAATKDHTHNYAGSSSAGGAATSADKLNIGSSNIGSATQPVYFDKTTGKPVAITNTIQSNVPADAVFTDTTYTVATGTQNGKIKVTPSVGSAYEVPVYGLGAAAYKGVADTVSTSTDLVTSTAVNTKLASYVPNSDFVVAENNITYAINNGGKNLLSKFQYYDNADKVTVNADGSVTLNATASSYDTNIHFAVDSDGVDRYKPMPADWVGKYFSGIVTANNAVIWIMEFSDDGSTWKRELTIRSANQKLEIPNDGYYKFTFKIAKNNAISNYTFKPMIADEVVYDTIGTGQPPALPNSNLTALEAEDRASLAEVVDSGAKNKFIPRSQTQAGITATVNSDNSLDVTWTAIGSSNEYCRINNDDLKLPVGTYVFSGLTESGDLNYYLHLEDSSGTVIGNIMPNTPNRCLEFKVTDATKNYKVYVAVMANSAAQSTAKKIYPMVCTKAAFGVSKAFVPYRPNWDLVYDAVNIVDITSALTLATGYTASSRTHIYKQGKHVFGTIVISKDSGTFPNSGGAEIGYMNAYRPKFQYVGGSFFSESEWTVASLGYAFVDSTSPGHILVTDTLTTNTFVKISIDYVIA